MQSNASSWQRALPTRKIARRCLRLRRRGSPAPSKRNANQFSPNRQTRSENSSAVRITLMEVGSAGRAQAIADSGFGEDVLRALRVGFDLLSELPHIDAQILRVG